MRPRVAGRTLTLVVALVAALAVPLTGSTHALAGPPGGTAPAGGNTPLPESHQVTLITGDVVNLTVHADGTSQARLVAPGRASGGYHQYNRDGDAYLVPASAERMVANGVLDEQLFDVSALVRQGLDDAHDSSLPLILSYPQAGQAGLRPLGRTPTPKGSHRHAVLTAVYGLAVTEDKHDADAFWSDLVGQANPAVVARTRLSQGVGHVWLDARVHAALDESVPQIGGPAAWARGYDGTGVTVAVLDTGIDPHHPDFAGRITATADFTGGTDAVDHAGHGTHVASILTGTGAASDGRYRGVAPGAHLMVGKVLGDDGSGSLSTVIAGMQWAASHGADVVNLSLGGAVSRGNDPLSQTLDALAERYGTLFVVAAGNHSPFAPGDGSVTTPAAADDALAVGSVNKRDRLALDSRRGRFGDTAVKPELVAPGVSITAARAAGTGVGDDPYYTTMSGTSMATPHAAGSAALLKQEHPDWTFRALKAALTSTAVPLAAYTATEAGAGRLDVDRATRQQVFTDQGTLDLGYLARPYDPDLLHQQRTLHYRNASDAPVTLHLSTTLTEKFGAPAPAGALSVSPDTLTLAPGATGAATVRLDASSIDPSTYTGRVVATGGADLRIDTVVSFYKQDDTVDVTVRALDRRGDPAIATLRLAPYKKEDFDGRYFPDLIGLDQDNQERIVRVPEGDYTLWATIVTLDASGRFVVEKSIVGIPRVRAHAPNPTIVLDARKARPVTLSTPRPTVIRSLAMSWWRGTPGGPFHSYDSMGVTVGDGAPERVSVAGTERVDDAPFYLTTAIDAAPPVLRARANGHRLDPVWEGGPAIDGRQHLSVADAGSASPAELAGRTFTGRAVLVRETPGVDLQAQADAVIAHGAQVVMLYSARPGVFWPAVGGTSTVLALPADQGDALHARLARHHRVTVQFDGQPNAPYAYDLAFTEVGQVPERLAYRVHRDEVAEVRTRLHGTGTGERGYRLHDFLYTPCDCDTSLLADYSPSVGYASTEYVTARPDTRVLTLWEYRTRLGDDFVFPRDAVSYRPGQRVTDDWLKAPFSPGPANESFHPFGATHQVSRFDDVIHYDIADWTDSAGHWAQQVHSTRPVSRLYRNGTLVGSSDFSLTGNVQVPADDATYRLEADVDHDGSVFGLSTHTRSAWTFHSAHSEGSTVLPLVDVDYTGVVDWRGRDLLDLANAAPGGAWATLELHADHQTGAAAPEVDTMTVSVSFDDGRTWQPARVRPGRDGQFQASYRHPRVGRDGGYVSIRVRASDPAGNALEQTLIRAYRLSGHGH